MITHPYDTNSGIPIRRYDEQGKLICDFVENQEGIFEYHAEKRFIVPPGLLQKVFEFHALIETCEGAPILITGPTGVGKSLFIHMYCEWYKKKKGKYAKINTVNCSHMEKSLARSELFGHVRGAFTGANRDKAGWIKEAEGGVLILEEIGELPPECQAQLLTFIEDGNYHRVGDTEIRHAADISILGATNKKANEMREDFWNRFLNFYIPPLHERRGDVLYYVAVKYPEIIKELHPWETLSLLAYHWPGNVREIDRVIRSIKATKYLRDHNPFKDIELPTLFDISREHSRLSPQEADYLFHDLKRNGFDVEFFEDLLNGYNVGLSTNNISKFFDIPDLYEEYLSHKHVMDFGITGLGSEIEKEKEIAILKEYEDTFKIEIPPICKPFFIAQLGYEIFCLLFFKLPSFNHNCLKIDELCTPGARGFVYDYIPKEYLEKFEKLKKQAFKFLSKIDLSEEEILPPNGSPGSGPSRWDFLLNLAEKYPGNEFLARIFGDILEKQDPAIDIFKMNEKELLKYYYAGLHERYGSSVEEIAMVSGKSTSGTYTILRRQGINIK